jgi:hypothetical protein
MKDHDPEQSFHNSLADIGQCFTVQNENTQAARTSLSGVGLNDANHGPGVQNLFDRERESISKSADSPAK